MRLHFASKDLEGLYTGKQGAHRYSEAIVEAFFEVVAFIAAAADQRDLYALRSLHFEKLRGREPERSLRLNRQWRLIVTLERDEEGEYVAIHAIEDYH